MPYISRPPPEVKSVEELSRWVREELDHLTLALSESTEVELRPRSAEPAKPREGMIVHADGTNWNPGEGAGTYRRGATGWERLGLASEAASALNKGAFSVNRNGTDQTGLTAGYNKIQFTNKLLDTNSWFDNVTNFRYTPLVAGWYAITVKVKAPTAVNDSVQAIISKNGVAPGSAYAYGTYGHSASIGNDWSIISSLVHFNGSSDYVEGWAYIPSTSIIGTREDTEMFGWRVQDG